MIILNVEDALSLFRELAKASGFDVWQESSFVNSAGCISSIRRGNAQLRLVWEGADGSLLIQISHGPPDGPQDHWLELFRSKCIRGSFPDADLPEVSFLSSVEYGLELMIPGPRSCPA